MKSIKILPWIIGTGLFFTPSCKKAFLDAKPNTNIVIPTGLDDMIQLLDNLETTTWTSPALPILSADEYYYPSLVDYNNTNTKTERNSFIWATDIYAGEKQIADWNLPYKTIFTANVILDAWDNLSASDQESTKGKDVKAGALFCRSNAFFNLVQLFSPVYNKLTASKDMGIPLKLSADINKMESRATVQATYDQILADLTTAAGLFSDIFPDKNRNRPSKAALYALLSRIYLSMQEYDKALTAANDCLSSYDHLIDYNTVDLSTGVPFSYYTDEMIYLQTTNASYLEIAIGQYSSYATMSPDLISLYDNTDLRKAIYFIQTGDHYTPNYGYAGDSPFPFTGLAVDEVYLIKAECQARGNDLNGAMNTLNSLLERRYATGTFTPFYASTATAILNKILEERRKELVWRGLRWSDLKRLNLEGANITLTRTLGGQTYTLPPNDPKYVMPIPDDEMSLSHIQQNPR